MTPEEAKKFVLDAYPDAECLMFPDNTSPFQRGIFSEDERRFLGWGENGNEAWITAAEQIKRFTIPLKQSKEGK